MAIGDRIFYLYLKLYEILGMGDTLPSLLLTTELHTAVTPQKKGKFLLHYIDGPFLFFMKVFGVRVRSKCRVLSSSRLSSQLALSSEST